MARISTRRPIRRPKHDETCAPHSLCVSFEVYRRPPGDWLFRPGDSNAGLAGPDSFLLTSDAETLFRALSVNRASILKRRAPPERESRAFLIRPKEPGLHSSILADPYSSSVRFINSYASLTRNGLSVAKNWPTPTSRLRRGWEPLPSSMNWRCQCYHRHSSLIPDSSDDVADPQRESCFNGKVPDGEDSRPWRPGLEKST